MGQQVVDGLLLVENKLYLGESQTIDTRLIQVVHAVGDVINLILEHDGVCLLNVVLNLIGFSVVVFPHSDPTGRVSDGFGIASLVLVQQPSGITVRIYIGNLCTCVPTTVDSSFELRPRHNGCLKPIADVIHVPYSQVEEQAGRVNSSNDWTVFGLVPTCFEDTSLTKHCIDKCRGSPSPHVVVLEHVLQQAGCGGGEALAQLVARIGSDLGIGTKQCAECGVCNGIDKILAAQQTACGAAVELPLRGTDSPEVTTVVATCLIKGGLFVLVIELTVFVDEAAELGHEVIRYE